MTISQVANLDCWTIEPKLFEDTRGLFCELFRLDTLEETLGRKLNLVQENYSYSKKNTLRGLHYQERNPQAKLIFVPQGEIFDVCVDVRKTSPTFGKWFGLTLSSSVPKLLFIPEGFAHGFLTLSETASIIYKTTAYYDPSSERTLRFDDPALSIVWPLRAPPILSAKDQLGSFLSEI